MYARLFSLLLLLLPLRAHAGDAGAPTAWVGIDFTLARFIGTADFREPDAIFPGYLNTWNGLWMDEMFAELPGVLRTTVTADNAGIFELNGTARPDQIERRDGMEELVRETTITPDVLAQQVKRYKLTSTSGRGLVFVVDRLVKLPERGCTWVVTFDVASRNVLTQDRLCKDAQGFGFRNYWFHVWKELVPDLKRLRE